MSIKRPVNPILTSEPITMFPCSLSIVLVLFGASLGVMVSEEDVREIGGLKEESFIEDKVNSYHYEDDIEHEASVVSPKEEEGEKRSHRVKRFLGLFNVVQFANQACNSSSDSSGSGGTCYTSTECALLGGRPGGICAAGFGVCCIFEYNCETAKSASQEVIYFRNRGFPQPQEEPDICLFSITVANKNICQIRLDFLEFELDPGSTSTSPCDRDSMEVLNTGVDGLGTGRLCGSNEGQHLYVPVMSEQSQPMLRLLTSGRDSVGAANVTRDFKYNIKITQIDCASTNEMMRLLRAPDRCLQYYTERSGTVNSFNWSPGSNVVYTKNQDYAICFRREAADCQLRLRRSASAPVRSTSVGASSGYTQGTNNCGQENGCRISDCIKTSPGNQGSGIPANTILFDHLEVTGAFFRQNVQNEDKYVRGSYFCGIGIGRDLDGTNNQNQVDGTDEGDGLIIRSSGPFVLRFQTDDHIEENANNAINTMTTPELGFSLDYNIGSCSTINERIST